MLFQISINLMYGFTCLDSGDLPDAELSCQNFKELCGSFQASLALGPCVLVIDGIDELGASVDLSPQEVCRNFIPLQ